MTLAVKHPWIWIALFLLTAIFVFHFAASSAAAQAVQLPTFHFFTTNTTVEVPDGGDAFLGGVGRSSSGRIQRGIPGLPSRPFSSVATGRSSAAAGTSVSAQIHDLDGMDRALLSDDAGSVLANSSQPFHPPLALAQQKAVLAGSGGSNALASVAALRAQVAAEDAARQKEALENLARGRQLLAEGKSGVAKIYLQNAARHSNGDVQQQALAALQTIEQGKASSKVAGR
jgi:hypothetical protein